MKKHYGHITMKENYAYIQQAIYDGRTAEALALIDAGLSRTPNDAHLLYLRGNLWMKQGEWGQAISMFQQAENIDPESPAAESRSMLDDIMNFYNKDMFNQ